VGLPGGDLRPDITFSRDEICREYGLPVNEPYVLVIQHSVTHSQVVVNDQIVETLEALAGLEFSVLLANPNDDAGGRVILEKMRQYAEHYPFMRLLTSPKSRERFASIMAHAGVLVGNSSSALVEAMSVCLPVVNIGDRQRGREHLAYWLNVDYDREQIRRAVETALRDDVYRGGLSAFTNEMLKYDTEQMTVDLLGSLDLGRGKRPKCFCWTDSVPCDV